MLHDNSTLFRCIGTGVILTVHTIHKVELCKPIPCNTTGCPQSRNILNKTVNIGLLKVFIFIIVNIFCIKVGPIQVPLARQVNGLCRLLGNIFGDVSNRFVRQFAGNRSINCNSMETHASIGRVGYIRNRNLNM